MGKEEKYRSGEIDTVYSHKLEAYIGGLEWQFIEIFI